MKKRKKTEQRRFCSILVIMSLLVSMFFANMAKASRDYLDGEPVLNRYAGSVDGVDRQLVITEGDWTNHAYFKVGEMGFKLVISSCQDAMLDQYGVIWKINSDNNSIMFRSYEITPGFDGISFLRYDHDVESFMVEGSGRQAIAVGYKTISGETKPLPTFDEIKMIMWEYEYGPEFDYDAITEPHYIPYPDTSNSPVPTQEPSKETTEPTMESTSPVATTLPPDPTQEPSSETTEPTIVPTTEPEATPTETTEPTTTQKPSISTGSEISVKKSGNSVEVTEDGDLISKVTFNKKKGIATFQVKNKNKKIKKVKQAFIIGDSYNYGYITKTNKFKTINRKTGKTKTYSGKWKKATIKKNVAVNVVKLKGNKKKKITGF